MCFKKSMLYVCLLTGAAMALAMAGNSSGQNSSIASEAPSGYDNQPNGLTDAPTFTMDRGKFEETEAIGDGLGPIFNAQSCRECHQNPVTGSTSQVKELRAGHQDNNGNFVAAVYLGETRIRCFSPMCGRAACTTTRDAVITSVAAVISSLTF